MIRFSTSRYRWKYIPHRFSTARIQQTQRCTDNSSETSIQKIIQIFSIEYTRMPKFWMKNHHSDEGDESDVILEFHNGEMQL